MVTFPITHPTHEEVAMPRPGIAVGAVYGKLEVVAQVEPEIDGFGHKRQRVRVRCECGEEREIASIRLTMGSATRCLSCARKAIGESKVNHHIGDKHDRLTIVGFVKEEWDGRLRRIAVCECVCGTEVKIRPEVLKTSKTNSCGCEPNGNWKGVGEISSRLWKTAQRGAATRGLSFNISPHYAWGLFLEQGGKCALSGLSLVFGSDALRTASLDRVDSTKGYEEGNVQWVHKVVNIMKWNLTEADFIQYCRFVAAKADGHPLSEGPPQQGPRKHSRGKSSHRPRT
jgi:hypothetical protein